MNDRNPFNGFSDRDLNDVGISITPALSLTTPESVSPNWTSTRGSSELAKRADNQITHEHYRALLTQTAMTNIAALTTLESKLSTAVPYAEERLRMIVDAYVISAARKIGRW